MKIDNLVVRENELMDAGKLDEQIISDFEKLIFSLEEYQKNHLDTVCKDGSPHHYNEWSNKNRTKIVYAKRIVESVRKNIPLKCNYAKGFYDCPSCGDATADDGTICSSCGQSIIH